MRRIIREQMELFDSMGGERPDFFAAIGHSGTMALPIYHEVTRIKPLILRKDAGNSHGCQLEYLSYPSIYETVKIAIVDDFVVSGNTLFNLGKILGGFCNNSTFKLVGGFFYQGNSFKNVEKFSQVEYARLDGEIPFIGSLEMREDCLESSVAKGLRLLTPDIFPQKETQTFDLTFQNPGV
jgi:hypothetical protein